MADHCGELTDRVPKFLVLSLSACHPGSSKARQLNFQSLSGFEFGLSFWSTGGCRK
jgi:hypothetical protein